MKQAGDDMKKFKLRRETMVTRAGLSSLGSLLSAVVASACCIGPALLALLGAGTVGLSGVLGMYRPYFIGLSVILLGIAFYLTYRKHEVRCEDGTFKTISAGKWDKISVWFAAVVTMIVIAIPSITAVHTAIAEPLTDGHANYKVETTHSVKIAADSCCEVKQRPSETEKFSSHIAGTIGTEFVEPKKGNSE